MAKFKIGVWNMEWLNDLFLKNNQGPTFKQDTTKVKGPHPDGKRDDPTVAQRLDILGRGLAALDVDVLVVVEGPDRTEELSMLMDRIAPGEWECFIQQSKSPNGPQPGSGSWSSQQCVGVAVRVDRLPFAPGAMTAFDAMEKDAGLIFEASEPFFMDTGQDKVTEWYRFERRPAYVELTCTDGAKARVLGLHLKSKGIFSAHEWAKWWALADANRERLVAQCRRMREAFITPYLRGEDTAQIPLIVAGDINDGPGFDASEAKLKASGVETLMGSVWAPEFTLGNALFDSLKEKDRERMRLESLATTRFGDPIFNGVYHKVWIDHILYSRNTPKPFVTEADIVHRIEDGQNTPFYRAADHYPITAMVEPPLPSS